MKKIFSFFNLKKALLNFIRDDSKNVQQAQFTGLNSVATLEVISPYGMSSKPVKDSQVLVFRLNSQQDANIGIVYDSFKRFKNLKEGEVVVGNYETKAKIYFKENGDIEIFANDKKLYLNGSEEPIVKGNQFESWATEQINKLNSNISVFTNHTHTGNLGAPTSPPLGTPMQQVSVPPSSVKSTKVFSG